MKCLWSFCSEERFSIKSLYDHTVQHIKQPPYICLWQGCQRRCDKKARLRVHLLTHIPYRAFPCTICSKTFKRDQELSRHFKAFHQDAYRRVRIEDLLNNY